jgi:hypothetical protein
VKDGRWDCVWRKMGLRDEITQEGNPCIYSRTRGCSLEGHATTCLSLSLIRSVLTSAVASESLSLIGCVEYQLPALSLFSPLPLQVPCPALSLISCVEYQLLALSLSSPLPLQVPCPALSLIGCVPYQLPALSLSRLTSPRRRLVPSPALVLRNALNPIGKTTIVVLSS